MRDHYTNPAIHKAFDVLEKLSADEEVRHLAEIREKALREKIGCSLPLVRKVLMKAGRKAN